ncbi:MAG: PilX N-terminal domain-containing pilus assembly protein [Gallionella sp.]|jgi:Tfp pilus assembly protein PilX
MKPANYRPYGNRKARQSGSTLIISMIILILLMMLGVTAMKTSDTQFQLAGNLQFEDSAMNNAETALVAAETWLQANFRNPGLLTDTCNSRSVSHLYPLNTAVAPPAPCLSAEAPLTTMAWNDTDSLQNGANDGQRYFIELMSVNNRLIGSGATIGGHASAGCNQVNTYRVTARGTSARGASKFVQSFYSVLNC